MKILHIGPVKSSALPPEEDSDFDVFPGLGIDGPSRSILGLANSLANHGMDIGVLPTKPFFNTEISALKKVKFLTPYTGKKYDPFINTDKWIRIIKKEFGTPDLVNFHDVYDLFSIAMSIAFKKMGWKYIVTPRGGLRKFAQKRDSWKKKIANPLFFNRYLRNAEWIHALTEQEAKETREFDDRLETRVVSNGIDREALNYSQKLQNRQNEYLTIGFLGQIFVEIKGVDILLKAISKFQHAHPKDKVKFEIVGPIRTKKDGEWVDRLLRDVPAPALVNFPGTKRGKEKWQTLNNFDVFVLPSRTEGMPVVGLEAMSLAKPCIFTSGTNMSRVIEEARGGWGCETNANALFERFCEVAMQPREEFIKRGQNAKKYIQENYTWDAIVKQYAEMVRT